MEQHGLLYRPDDLPKMIEDSGANDLAGYVERSYVARPEEPLPQSQNLPPLKE